MIDFKNKIKKNSSKRNIKITNSWGSNDACAYYRSKIKSEGKLKDSEFRQLIKLSNHLMSEDLLNTGQIQLPVGLGTVSIYSKERKPRVVDGKLEYNAPIDWNRTLELWATDPESRVAKTLVKMPPGITYQFKYHTTYRGFNNRKYMMFKPTRGIKLALKKRLDNNVPVAHIHRK